MSAYDTIVTGPTHEASYGPRMLEDDGHVTDCPPEQAEFWGVYVRKRGVKEWGWWDDVDDRDTAAALANAIAYEY